MFLPFLDNLRLHRVPASLREFLDFLAVVKRGVAIYDIDAFYLLARTTLVKDERHLDRFDQAFAASFSGLEQIDIDQMVQATGIPRGLAAQAGRKNPVARRNGRYPRGRQF